MGFLFILALETLTSFASLSVGLFLLTIFLSINVVHCYSLSVPAVFYFHFGSIFAKGLGKLVMLLSVVNQVLGTFNPTR